MINEGMELGDLARLVHSELHVDEFKSKLGRDEDIIVLSFKIRSKEPGYDLVNFIEKGYPWVVDADVSSGEMDDGDYIVFVEIERKPEAIKNIMYMMEDIMNLTKQNLKDWRVRYYTGTKDHSLDAESLRSMIPLSAAAYLKKFGKKPIDDLKTAAGVKVDTKAPKNDMTESLRIAAGIR